LSQHLPERGGTDADAAVLEKVPTGAVLEVFNARIHGREEE